MFLFVFCGVVDGHLSLGRIKAATVYIVVAFSSPKHWRGGSVDESMPPRASYLESPRFVSLIQASTSYPVVE